MSALVNIVEESAIPVCLGIWIVALYRSHPERFPRRWTPPYVTFVATVLIVGSVLLAIWSAYSHPH